MAKSEVEKKRKQFSALDAERASSKKAKTTSTSKVTKAADGVASKMVTKKISRSEPAVREEDDVTFEGVDSDPDNLSAASDQEDPSDALLKVFDSDSEGEAGDFDDSNASKKSKKRSSMSQSVTKPNDDTETGEPTVVYISRIPHGFYEREMRSYFTQFGTLKNLRLCKNRRTGASKHYAFMEFEDSEVARIVADTMDNYLLFGHILKVKLVDDVTVKNNLGGREGLFKNSNRRFKKVPWNYIERYRIKSTDRNGWNKRVMREEKRRAQKMENLKELGYDFQPPKLRAVEDVPVQMAIDQPDEVRQIADKPADVEEKQAEEALENSIEEKPAGDELKVEKKTKKVKDDGTKVQKSKKTKKLRPPSQGNYR